MAKLKLPPISPLIGTNLPTFLKVIAGRKIRSKRWLHVLLSLIIIILSTPFRLFDIFYFKRHLKQFHLKYPPVFIIGYWRSGTTFLHNLLCQDPRSAYVTTYHSVFPNYLRVKPFFSLFMRRIMPKYRPGDNIKMGINFPQEDEYALANSTPYAFYHFFYFPHNYKEYFEKFVRFTNINSKVQKEFLKEYTTLVKKACLNTGGEFPVLKNPLNTGRIKQLLQLYPDAKFIHIVRNPIEVYCSAKKFFSAVIPTLSFQKVTQEDLIQIILWLYENLMKAYLRERALIPKKNFYEIRYENLLAHPEEEIQKIYKHLNIKENIRKNIRIKNFLATQKNHKTGSYQLTESELGILLKRWSFAMKEWNYHVTDHIRIIENQVPKIIATPTK